MHRPTDKRAIIRLLKEHGIHPTPQRVEIAQVLFEGARHVSADQVLNEVLRRGGMVSKATVYNTLGLFAKKGLIREVIVDPTRVFYDPNAKEHYHFYNEDTGELQDIDPEALSLGELPPVPPGTLPAGVDVIIRLRNAPKRA
ncbi:MAG: transcriptional repressor [Gammaproteobacteria bacterium]|nr:MAG: transcriptional repressor [Gammaproteobacteria bacterium]